jgi:hypothetical protein
LLPGAAAVDRRKALLVVANLCIPIENKAVILLGEPIHDLLPALLRIMRDCSEDSYLATACLFNLSQLNDAKQLLMRYTALPANADNASTNSNWFDHPYSVLRTLENLMVEYTPILEASISILSVQSEAFRWSMGTLRHLVTNASNAIIVSSKTRIPALAVKCLGLAASTIPLVQWTRDSLPDACLMFLVHLAQHDECLPALRDTDYADTLCKVKGGGIHELRARALWGVLHDGQEDDADICNHII